MNEEVQKEAEALKQKLTTLEKGVENGATKEELQAQKEEVDSLKEQLKKALEVAEKQGESITLLKENGASSSKAGSMSKFIDETVKSFDSSDKYHSAKTTIKAAALMTTANITPVVASGFSPLFTNYFDNDVNGAPKPDNFIMSLVDVRTQLGTESIYYSDRVNEEGDAEFIGEGTLKPLADAEWKTSKKNIKEVALRWKFTKRLMNHAPSVEADFREHANELMEQKMDDVALSGDEGVDTNQFDGITTLASPFIVPVSLADYYTKSNIYDVINAVATYVRLNNFKGQLTCVLNTVWKAKMQGIKTTEGDYIVPPFVTQDGNTVGEVRVQFENKMPETEILLGDLKKYKIVIAENIEYDEGYENDDFSKNLVSRKLEAFMGSYLKDSDVGSIVYDTIATIQTAIDVDLV